MMKKQSIGSLILGRWNARTIAGIAAGAAAFGVLMVFGRIKVTSNTSLTSAYVVLPIVGALFGPLPAAITGLLGSILSDLIGGWDLWFDWSFGHAVAGFFIGLLPVYGAKIGDGIFEVKHAVIYVIATIVGVIIAFGAVSPLLTSLFYAAGPSVTWVLAQAALISNASVAIVMGIPVLFALARRCVCKIDRAKED